MAYQVTLQPSGRQFAADSDKTLLEAALDAGVGLPYGCKNGACGACKSKVTSGSVDHGKTPDHVLAPEARAAGEVLTCCAKATSDLVLEARVVDSAAIPAKIMPCRVETMEQLASDIMLLKLRLPANERLQFVAGQYIEFLLADGKRRAFSLANAPHDDALLEVHVRLVPGGSFTEHVFKQMKPRDILRIEGPFGSFYLREDSSKPILLVAGGTGFAPIKGLVEHALHQGIQRPMKFYWGAKDPSGLYMKSLAENWAAQHGIEFVPVLSEPDAAWYGRSGIVHQAVLADHPDLSIYQVYVCGAPVMCEAALKDFTAAGLPAEEFFADAFSYAPRQ